MKVRETGPVPAVDVEHRPADRRRSGRGGRSGRRLADRVTVSTLVGVAAALLVFVLTAVLLRDRREMVTVAVASERVPAGVTVTAGMVEAVEVPASVSFAERLVGVDELGDGVVATRTLQAGEPVPRSAVGEVSASSGVRVMAIPVEAWQAAGGRLDVGDQVDVIDTGDGGPRFVLAGASVVDRAADDRGGGLGGSSSGRLWVSVEVSADQALDLAAVVDRGEFVLVRSTGATDVPVLVAAPSVSSAGGG